MYHAPFANLHAAYCRCRACSSPAERRSVRRQAFAFGAVVVGFYAFAAANAGSIAAAFGVAL